MTPGNQIVFSDKHSVRLPLARAKRDITALRRTGGGCLQITWQLEST